MNNQTYSYIPNGSWRVFKTILMSGTRNQESGSSNDYRFIASWSTLQELGYQWSKPIGSTLESKVFKVGWM